MKVYSTLTYQELSEFMNAYDCTRQHVPFLSISQFELAQVEFIQLNDREVQLFGMWEFEYYRDWEEIRKLEKWLETEEVVGWDMRILNVICKTFLAVVERYNDFQKRNLC